MIEICAYRGTSFISRLIRWQTRSVYSHIAIRFLTPAEIRAQLQFGRSKVVSIEAGNVIEALKGGVRLCRSISEAHTPGTRVDIFRLKTPLEQTQEILLTKFMVAQLGKPYDYLAILRFLTREPASRWSKKRWFCSELGFEAFLTAGIELLACTPAWKVPPAWLPMSPLLAYRGSETTKMNNQARTGNEL